MLKCVAVWSFIFSFHAFSANKPCEWNTTDRSSESMALSNLENSVSNFTLQSRARKSSFEKKVQEVLDSNASDQTKELYKRALSNMKSALLNVESLESEVGQLASAFASAHSPRDIHDDGIAVLKAAATANETFQYLLLKSGDPLLSVGADVKSKIESYQVAHGRSLNRECR